MTDNMPPLIAHPSWHIGCDWSDKEIRTIHAYARAYAEQQNAELRKELQTAVRLKGELRARIEYLENAPCPDCGFPIGSTHL